MVHVVGKVPESRFRLGNYGGLPIHQRWEMARTRLERTLPKDHPDRSLLSAHCDEYTIDEIEKSLLRFGEEKYNQYLKAREEIPPYLLKRQDEYNATCQRYFRGWIDNRDLRKQIIRIAGTPRHEILGIIPLNWNTIFPSIDLENLPRFPTAQEAERATNNLLSSYVLPIEFQNECLRKALEIEGQPIEYQNRAMIEAMWRHFTKPAVVAQPTKGVRQRKHRKSNGKIARKQAQREPEQMDRR